MPTPNRSVRVPDEIWLPAQARAEREGRKLADVITDGLRTYADGQPVMQPNPGPVAVMQPLQCSPTPQIGTPNRVRPAMDATGQPCKHPSARVLRNLCGACGTFVG